MQELRELIADGIKEGVYFYPDEATDEDWREVADRILAIPEIAEALALKRKFDGQRRSVEEERDSGIRTVATPPA